MMRTARSAYLVSLLAPWLLGACGAAGDTGSDVAPDAGAASPSCTMRLSFAPAMPSTLTDVVITATIDINGDGLTGYWSYDWQVSSSGGIEVPVTPRNLDGSQISFRPEAPGPHRVIASGAVGDVPCYSADELLNVLPADSTATPYRLRLVPRPGQDAPAQEHQIALYAGTDYDLGEVPLSTGVQVSGTVQSGDAEPLAAYVRAAPEDAEEPAFVEAFAGEQGELSMRLENRRYHVLVVPADNQHAPARFDSQRAGLDWDLTVSPADLVSGTVSDGAGTPLADARVTMRAGAIPSTIATSDDTGAFALQARLGSNDSLTDAGPVTLTVVPPAPSGLPMLHVPGSAGLDQALTGTPAGGDIAVAYAPALSTRTIAPSARLADGSTPAAGTRATWISRPIADAGTVTPAGGTPLAATGTARLSATAGPDGTWPPLTLPEAVYDLILEPPAASGEPVTLLEIDLSADAPEVLSVSLAQPATLRGQVTGAGGTGLGQVRITATPTGLLSQSARTRTTTTTAADGSFALDVTGNGTYELLLDSPDPSHGRRHLTASAPAPGQSKDLDPLALPAARRITGRVTVLGTTSSMGGITVQVLCAACSAPERSTPLAETVTDATGAFVLAVPEATP